MMNLYTPPKRLSKIGESATLKAAEKARELRAKGVDVISLDVGEPDFPTPKPIIEAAYRALNDGLTKYSQSQGLIELRETISDNLRRLYGIEYLPNEIIITPGAKMGVFYALTAILDEGDEVIIPTPAWPSYFDITKFAGGNPVEVRTGENFELLPDIIDSLVTEKTKALLLNYPNNPTGVLYDRRDLERLAEVVERRNLLVISDEIYCRLVYDGEFIPFSKISEMRDRTITVNGFSKAYSMTGWRLGYIYGPKNIIKEILKVQQQTATHPPTFIQKAAVTALNDCENYVKEMVKEFKFRRDIVYKGLKEMGFKVQKANGAFYFFPNAEDVYSEPEKFSEHLLEKAAVNTTPGTGFGKGYEKYFRISYATSREKIEEAILRMKRFLNLH
ncbi:MAG: pyridoxal phosphate-dependent aminotransferase [Nitrososphaeria archaeon]|nr:pyridoxal phosphate-dependent aminotransferase [Nitrososphaeria archaeon]